MNKGLYHRKIGGTDRDSVVLIDGNKATVRKVTLAEHFESGFGGYFNAKREKKNLENNLGVMNRYRETSGNENERDERLNNEIYN